jgi:hypothetical protein
MRAVRDAQLLLLVVAALGWNRFLASSSRDLTFTECTSTVMTILTAPAVLKRTGIRACKPALLLNG